MPIEDRYERAMGRKPSYSEMKRFLRLQEVLGLRENDALWTVVFTLETYNDKFKTYPETFSSIVRQELRIHEATWVTLSALGLAYTFLVGATGVYLGHGISNSEVPSWYHNTAGARPLLLVATRILSAPAGWAVLCVASVPLGIGIFRSFSLLLDSALTRSKRALAGAILMVLGAVVISWIILISQ